MSQEQFWRNLEQQLGRPVVRYALGQYLSGRDADGPLWGLFYFTDDTLYFRHFAQANWFSALTAGGGEEDEPKDPRKKNIIVEIPLAQCGTLESPPVVGPLRRFFFGGDEVCTLYSRYTGVEPTRFTIENRREDFLQALQGVMADTAP